MARIIAIFDRVSPVMPEYVDRVSDSRVVSLDADVSIGEQIDNLMQVEKQRIGVH